MCSLIIGLNGPAGCGKTTAAKRLIEAHGFTRVRFADPLKAMCRGLGLSVSDVDGETKEVPSALLRHEMFHYLFEHVPDAFGAIGLDINDDGFGYPSQLYGRQLGFAGLAFMGVITQVVSRGEKDGGATPRLLMQMLGTEWARDQIHKDFWVNLWRERVKGLDRVVADDCRFPNEVEALRKSGGILVEIVRPSNTLNVGTHESEAHRFEPDFKIHNDDLDDFFASIDGVISIRVAA